MSKWKQSVTIELGINVQYRRRGAIDIGVRGRDLVGRRVWLDRLGGRLVAKGRGVFRCL
jgi:hypothetical protein